MRFSFSMILILSFISLAVFGFFGMGEMNNNHVSCIAAEIQNGKCPVTNTLFSFAGYHLDAFKVFSNAVFNGGVLLLLIFAFLIFSFTNILKLEFSSPIFASASRNSNQLNFTEAKCKFLRWLSFRENSPTVVF